MSMVVRAIPTMPSASRWPGMQYVAPACQQLNAPLVYISTNEVFDGTGGPHFEYDRASPINAYGRSKWAGEQAVRELLQRFYIVRVWPGCLAANATLCARSCGWLPAISWHW
ncbi:MAG: sugar nucleotide-binding protein [Kouleothrix sp.]